MIDISPPVRIFFCYAHKDEPLLKRLKNQLGPFLEEGLIEVWDDRDIDPGVEWEPEISSKLDAAHIILPLVSPDFMGSPYCRGVEMKRALERHERGEAKVIPIILRPAHWDMLRHLQALPTNARPVKNWSNQDDGFFDIAEGLRNIIKGRNTSSVNTLDSNDQELNLTKSDSEPEEDNTAALPSHATTSVSGSYQFEGEHGRMPPPFVLQKGLYKVGLTYQGSDGISVNLYDGAGDLVKHLFSKFPGKYAIKFEYNQDILLRIQKNGAYIFEIHADGRWEIKIDQIS
jgi:hypothetical protein